MLRSLIGAVFAFLVSGQAFATDYYLIKMSDGGATDNHSNTLDIFTVTGNTDGYLQLGTGTGTCREDGMGGTDSNFNGKYAHQVMVILSDTSSGKGPRIPQKVLSVRDDATKPTPGKTMNAGYSWGSGTCTVVWDNVTTTYKKLYGTPIN